MFRSVGEEENCVFLNLLKQNILEKPAELPCLP